MVICLIDLWYFKMVSRSHDVSLFYSWKLYAIQCCVETCFWTSLYLIHRKKAVLNTYSFHSLLFHFMYFENFLFSVRKWSVNHLQKILYRLYNIKKANYFIYSILSMSVCRYLPFTQPLSKASLAVKSFLWLFSFLESWTAFGLINDLLLVSLWT